MSITDKRGGIITSIDDGYNLPPAAELQTFSSTIVKVIRQAISVELLSTFVIDQHDGKLSEIFSGETALAPNIQKRIFEYLEEIGTDGYIQAFEVPKFLNLPVAVIMPLRMNQRLIGIIALGPKSSGQAYDERELEYLSAIGNLAAMALENASLTNALRDLNHGLEQRVLARTQHLVELNKLLTEQYSQLQTLDEIKESLTRMVVHDLKNPLGTILLGLEFIESNQADLLPETVRNTLNIMTATAQEMQDLIANLLDVNRMEAGYLQLNKEPTPINEIISEGLKRVQVLAQSRKVRFELNCRENLNAFLDRALMTRVVVNLLVNAVKFAKRGTEVKITATLESNNDLILIFTNHGQVIPAEALPRLFEKFFQVESKNYGLASGNGLGLTFCKMVTEEHGGRIEVTSPAPGWEDGARFTLILPSVA